MVRKKSGTGPTINSAVTGSATEFETYLCPEKIWCGHILDLGEFSYSSAEKDKSIIIICNCNYKSSQMGLKCQDIHIAHGK